MHWVRPMFTIVFACAILAGSTARLEGQMPLSGFASNPPTLDGTIDPVEWQEAATATFLITYCGEDHQVTIGVMNDATYLYIALTIRDEDWPSLPEVDEFILHFDDDADGVREVGENTWRLAMPGQVSVDAHHPGGPPLNFIPDVAAQGTDDLDAAISHSSPNPGTIGDYRIEARHPIDSLDDAHDPSWALGSLATLAISIVETALPPACASAFPDPDPASWILIGIVGPIGCPGPIDLTLQASCDASDIDVSWTNSSNYDSIAVDVVELATGMVVANENLPGTATGTTLTVPTRGEHQVNVTGICAAGTTGSSDEGIYVEPFPPGTTNAVGEFEGSGGMTDSADALFTALQGIGRDAVFVGDLLAFTCRNQMGPGMVFWVTLGTFPENHVLTVDEGNALVELLLSGVSIYIEGADHWGFDPPTPFRDYDGILGVATDGNVIENGDDSLTALIGLEHEGLDFTANSGLYEQDSLGSDSTDRLIPTGDPSFAVDLLGGNAGVVWQSSAGYGVGVYYVPPVLFGGGGSEPGKVLGSFFEFGGYCGDEEDVIQKTSLCLKGFEPGSDFIRGDCNGDGMCDVGDAIFALGGLFGTAGPQWLCGNACDVNDDGMIDIADAVFKLAFLFNNGAAPPDPFGGCGSDPTLGPLGCEEAAACP